MESRVYWLFVICYVACVLRKNALGVSMSVKVFTSINNASRSERDAGVLKTENTRTVQSMETKTRLDGITLKDGWSKFDIPLESPKDLSEMIKFPSNFLKARCSRYCIQQVKTGENDSVVKDNFLLGNSLNTKIERNLSIDNKNSTILDNC